MSVSTASAARPHSADQVEALHLKQRRHRNFMENFASARFLLPIMVVFIVVILIPFLQSLVFSFTDYSGYNFADAKFVGFANYVQCFKDPTLLAGPGFTLLCTVATTVLITVIALPLAVVLNRKFFGRNFARSRSSSSRCRPWPCSALVWQYIFSPLKSGVVNTLLAKIGIDAIPWLSNSELAKFCVIFVAVWAQIGWHATLYLAYLRRLSPPISTNRPPSMAQTVASSSSTSHCPRWFRPWV
ncbi:MAG: carbohydrate ABC transporter permease [Bifidobacterium bifidum]